MYIMWCQFLFDNIKILINVNVKQSCYIIDSCTWNIIKFLSYFSFILGTNINVLYIIPDGLILFKVRLELNEFIW